MPLMTMSIHLSDTGKYLEERLFTLMLFLKDNLMYSNAPKTQI